MIMRSLALLILFVLAATPAAAQFDPFASGEPPARTREVRRPKATKPGVPVTAKPAEPAAKPATAPAKPSTIPATLQGVGMKVVVVRSGAPGCEPQCPEWIAAQGMIDHDTLPQFRKVLKAIGNRKLPILIDSGGGVVDDSLEIGRLIRAKGLDVAVAKTVLRPCPDTDPICRKAAKTGAPVQALPIARLSKCASSCAFILAAGSRRYVGPTTFVGVHQVTTFQTTAQILQKYRIEKKLVWGVPVETRRTLISEKRVNEKTVVTRTPESTYARVARYFSEMGIASELMPLLKSTPNTSIHWLTRAELKSTAMATDAIDGEQLIVGATLPVTAGSSPPPGTSFGPYKLPTDVTVMPAEPALVAPTGHTGTDAFKVQLAPAAAAKPAPAPTQ